MMTAQTPSDVNPFADWNESIERGIGPICAGKWGL